jgi:hypothetical protein
MPASKCVRSVEARCPPADEPMIPDAGGIKAVAAGPGAHGAQGAGNIVEHDGMTVTVGTETIFENVGGDAVGGEPLGVTLALVGGESAVAAAGKNEHGRAVAFFRRRRERGEGGNVLRGGAESAGSGV